MAIDPRSRYHGARQLDVTGPDGEPHTMLVPRVTRQPTTNGTYEIRAGDRLDLLGQTAFRDTTQWWRLADANPFHDASQLERPGAVIGLPDE